MGDFLLFYGKRVIKMNMRLEVLVKDRPEIDEDVDSWYTMHFRYPKIVTRNMQIDVHNYLYLQPTQ